MTRDNFRRTEICPTESSSIGINLERERERDRERERQRKREGERERERNTYNIITRSDITLMVCIAVTEYALATYPTPV